MDDIPTAVWSGTFRIWNIDLRCHVLSDGRRIIEKASFEQFMDALAEGAPIADDTDLMAFFRWQRGHGP